MNDVKLVERASNATSCVYCHDRIEYADSTWRCPRCATLHHTECSEEHGRCAVFGCDPDRARRDGWHEWQFVSGVRPSRRPRLAPRYAFMIVGLVILLGAAKSVVDRFSGPWGYQGAS